MSGPFYISWPNWICKWIDWKIKEHLQANVNPTALVDPHYVTEPSQWVQTNDMFSKKSFGGSLKNVFLENTVSIVNQVSQC